MNKLHSWFCRKRNELIRWSLVIAAASPVVAWTVSRAFAVDPRAVIVAIGFVLFAVWRPYRDSWLRQVCDVRQPCVSR